MGKVNNWFGATLAIVSLLTIAAVYFNIAAMAIMGMGWCFAAFVGFVAMMQTYHHKNFCDYNPSTFWFWFSLTVVVILFVSFVLSTGRFINQELGIAIVKGGLISLTPMFGLFLGECGRILKNESSTI